VTTRRRFFAQTAAVVAAAACRKSAEAPAAVTIDRRTVIRVVRGMPTVDGAGVKLTRVLGQPALRNFDPFVLLDRIHSDVAADYVRGFPDHPHRGFETVTVMLDGRIRHHDSKDNQGVIVGGGAQWMTAGRGIVHSEMPAQDEGPFSGFQLWVNLPAAEKMCPQFYQDLQPAQLVEESLGGGGRVRVISGAVNGAHGPVRLRPTDPTLLTIDLADDAPFEIDLPRDHAVFAFVHAGALTVGDQTIVEGNVALFGAGNRVTLQARAMRTQLLFAAGKPLQEPIVQRGPFVMNTDEEIERAWDDYRKGVLAT
jgi:redox-sensitive bicupin YhaK (pirin superfamily)